MDAETALVTSTDAENDSLAPRSFFLRVSFNGELPPNLRNEKIPLRVSISLPPEYAPYTRPVLRTVPDEDTSDEQSSTSDEFASMSDDDEPLTHGIEVQEIPIPFLPLAQSFDHRDGQSWSKLVEVISDWLVNDVRTLKRQEWTWGTDTFWMAFVAAYPSFPCGTWPVWDCHIALDGTFIHEWLDHGGREGWSQQFNVPFNDNSEGLANFHDQIWCVFNGYVPGNHHLTPWTDSPCRHCGKVWVTSEKKCPGDILDQMFGIHSTGGHQGDIIKT
ncbi:hypothetical protein F5887DRAFT_916126 [Amanita rubescens]|nr:hypothetical protein F5887DRAFT_916126 [Amanita rubescens]